MVKRTNPYRTPPGTGHRRKRRLTTGDHQRIIRTRTVFRTGPHTRPYSPPLARRISSSLASEAGSYIGGVVAGPIGATVGSDVGGHVGRSVYDAAFPQKKTTKMVRSTVNVLANKSSMKKTKGKNDKVKKGKKVKVSPYLKKAVTQILTTKDKKGMYYKSWCGVIGVWRGNVNINGTAYNVDNGGFKFGQYGGNAGKVLSTVWANDIPQYSRMLIQGLSNANAAFGDGQDLLFFTHAKFLDAASVLWNRKSKSINAYNNSGNLNMNTNTAPAVSTAVYGGTQIKVKNSYCVLNLKNNSQRTMRLQIYICVPKKTGDIPSPLQCLIDSLTIASTDGTAAAQQNLYLKNNNNEIGTVLVNPILSPALFPGFSNNWRYEILEIRLAPGEEVSKTFQGPKNTIVDWNKLNVAETNSNPINVTKFLAKNQCVSLMIGITPEPIFAVSHKEDATTFTDLPWMGPGVVNTTSTVNMPMTAYVDEHFELYIPENVGFVVAPDNANQSLNQRKPSIAYGNFTGGECDGTETAPVLVDIDENDPTTLVPSSRFV